MITLNLVTLNPNTIVSQKIIRPQVADRGSREQYQMALTHLYKDISDTSSFLKFSHYFIFYSDSWSTQETYYYTTACKLSGKPVIFIATVCVAITTPALQPSL